MKDTSPAIERRFRRMLLKRSGEERLKMGFSMQATARMLAKASLLETHPGSNSAELKRLLFLRFYGADFDPEQRHRIASALSKRARREPLRLDDPASVKSSGVGGVRENEETYGGKGKGKTKRPRRRPR